MFFDKITLRRFCSIYLCLIVPALISGCGLSLGDKTPEAEAVVVSPDRYNCLSEIGLHISKYFADDLSSEEIGTVVSCMKRAVIQFERYTHGKNGNSYTPEEFKRFVQQYFMKDRIIPDKLVVELMTLKIALVGGNKSEVTREELLNLSDFIGFLGDILLELKPYLSIFNLKVKVDLPEGGCNVELGGPTDTLLKNAVKLGEWLGRSERSYSLDSFESLVHQVREFSEWGEIHKKSYSAAEWITLLRTFKSAMVRPPAHIVMSKDWVPLMGSMAKWFKVWLNYKYHISNGPILYGKGFNTLVESSELAIQLLRDSLNLQPDREISYEQIFSLVDAVGELKLWPSKIRIKSIRSTFKMVFNKIFGDSSITPRNRLSPGLSRLVLTRMEKEFYGWAAVQRHLDEGYSEILRQQPFRSELYGGDRPDSPIHIDLEGQMKPFPKNAIHFIEMDHIIRFTSASYQSSDRAAMIVYPSQRFDLGLAHGIHSLSRSNILRVLTRLLFRGYSTQKNFMEGVTEEEMQDFYLDARAIGTDLGIYDSRSKNVGRRAFMEGNLFTAYSDGLNTTVKGILPVILPGNPLGKRELESTHKSKKSTRFIRRRNRKKRAALSVEASLVRAHGTKSISEPKEVKAKVSGNNIRKSDVYDDMSDIYEAPNPKLLSFKETLDLIALVYSGGILRDRMYSFLLKKCNPAMGEDGEQLNDPFGKAKIRKSCVRENLLEGVEFYFTGMPNLVSYLQKRTEKAKFETIDVILSTARREGQDEDLIELSELAVVAMIVQYSESLMVRFDHNEDQIVSNVEIWKYVYPVFRGFVHKMAINKFGRDLTDEGDIRSTLAFIIEKGRLPEGDSDFAGIWIDSLFHFDDSTDWDLSVDRGDLFKVFAAVIKASNHNKEK